MVNPTTNFLIYEFLGGLLTSIFLPNGGDSNDGLVFPQEGHYEYKYVVDGEWTCNYYELVTLANKDGHVNNYVQVLLSFPRKLTDTQKKVLSSSNI